MKLVEEESRTLPLTNGVQALHKRPVATFCNSSNVNTDGIQATVPVPGDVVVSCEDFHTIGSNLNGQPSQNAELSGPSDVYERTDSWTIHDLENQEAFRDLNIEGLADLAFIFSAENTSLFQSGEGLGVI